MGGGAGIGTGAPISPLSPYEHTNLNHSHAKVRHTRSKLKSSPHVNVNMNVDMNMHVGEEKYMSKGTVITSTGIEKSKSSSTCSRDKSKSSRRRSKSRSKSRRKSKSRSQSRKKVRPPDKPLPPVGLKNVGNTCYANAALQCVLSTALSHALMDPKSTHIFRRYSSNPGILALGSGSVDSDDNNDSEYEGPFDASSPIAMGRQKRMEARIKDREKKKKLKEKQLKHETCTWLTGELTDVTRIYTATHLNLEEGGLLQGGQESESYRNKWPNLFNIFSVTDEQRIVDPGGITRHVNKISPCLRPYQQEDAHEFLRSLLSTLTLDGHNRRLSSLFDGLLESAVTCQTCHRASITRDRYMDLSLDIQGKEINDLQGALKHFTQTELLDQHNKVICQRCQTKRIVSKGLRLATAPSVLVCHLKRFAFDIYGRTTRLAKYVKYPLQLEIGDFMSRANQSKPPPYELLGVLVHAGQSCERGHYLAFVKSGDCWYKANDEVVEKVDEEVVLRQQAYILFYEVAGMRARHGYEGFGKYHRRAMRKKNREARRHKSLEPTGRTNSHSPSAQDRNLSKSNSDANNAESPDSAASKVTSILDSMLSLCGANSTADAVRDSICDSSRKSSRKKKKHDVKDAESKTYTTRMRPLSQSETHSSKRSSSPLSYTSSGSKSKQRSKSAPKIKTPSHKSQRSSSRSSNRDSIFRCPTPDTMTRRATSETGAEEYNTYYFNAMPQTLPAKPNESTIRLSANDRTFLTNGSALIRSVSSNNMFEKEADAISCYEEESFVSGEGNNSSVILSDSDSLGKIQFSPAQSSHLSPQKFRYDSDEEDRMSDSAAMISPRKSSQRRKSISTPRSRRDVYVESGMLSRSSHGVKLPPLPRKPISVMMTKE